MSVEIATSLASQLANAYSILETTVYRTQQGEVFTIEIGESMLKDSAGSFGAKVTSIDKFPIHLGTCEGSSIEAARIAAQEIIATAIKEGRSRAA